MTHFASYIINNHRIQLLDFDGNSADLCEEISVKEVVRDINTHKITFMIEIFHSSGTSTVVEVPRKEAILNPITALVDHGLSIANHPIYNITLAEILLDLEKSAPISYIHSKLGFHNMNGTKIFLAAETNTPLGISRYKDLKKLESRGTYNAWRTGAVYFTSKKPELLLALAMGGSAPVASILEETGEVDQTMLWALIGPSSTGKSSATKFSCDPWGLPSTKGLIDTLVDTENYLISKLSALNGFPYFIEEISSARWDFTSLLYNLSMSVGKGRCFPDGTPKPVKRWHASSILFNGESSLFNQTNKNLGLYVRLLEFSFVWTKDANFAEELARFVSEQYGTAGQPFIEHLQSIDMYDLASMYRSHVDILKKITLPQNGVEERISKKLAVLRLTIQLMEKAWELPIDQAAVDDLLITAFEQNAPKADKYEVFYENLKQYIVGHEHLFPDDSSLKNPFLSKTAKHGYISKYKHQHCVWIMSDFFEDYLIKHNLVPTNDVLHALKDRHMLVHFGDRFRKGQKFGKTGSVLCYCLLLDNTSTTSTSNTPNKNAKSKSQIDYLLSDEDEAV